jgi:hypothetical protein
MYVFYDKDHFHPYQLSVIEKRAGSNFVCNKKQAK